MVKILIMDDEPALRNIVTSMVKPLGHPLFTAEDGRQAIEIGRREIPDLALLDMRVPDMDGLEVLAELQKINPEVRCIMLSGFGDVETAVSAIKEGAFDYISKPFKIDEVLKVVNKAINSLGRARGASGSSQGEEAPRPEESGTGAKKASESAKKKPGVIMWALGGTFVSLIVLGLVLKGSILGKGAPKEFSIPYNNPTGLCWIQSNLWISDWVSGNIYQHKQDSTLSIASVTKLTNSQPTGLAFDGTALWTCSSMERRIYKHRMDDALTPEAIFSTPDCNPSGLFFDGANLWVLDSEAAKIRKHKMDESLTLLATFDSPALNPCGMFRKDEDFYIGDYKTGRVYRVSVKDFTVAEVYSIPYFEQQNLTLAGLASDGKNLWLSAEGVGKIYQMPLKGLRPVKL